MMVWVGWMAVTMPTDWPAIMEPCSVSPSMTARRRAPAQKCSISSWAASLVSSPDWKRSRVAAWWARKRLVPALTRPRTGMTGKRSLSWMEGMASRALARMKACLKFGWAIDWRRRRSGCRAGRRRRPFRGRPGWLRRGRCRRRRTPGPRGFRAGFPAPGRSG